MKKLTFILAALFALLCLNGCESDPYNENGIEHAFINTKIYQKGINVIIEVTAHRIEPQYIMECGIHWEMGASEYTYAIDPDNARHAEQAGGQSTYYFEVFPWDGMYGVYRYDKKFVAAKPYMKIKADKRAEIEGRVYSEKIEPTVWVDVHSAEIVRQNVIIPFEVKLLEEGTIEEVGIYWSTGNSDTIGPNHKKIAMPYQPGEQRAVIPNGVEMGDIYCFAYAKTPLGTIYSSRTYCRMPGDEISVTIYPEIIDYTHERVTLKAKCTVENEQAYPITERGFCYLNTTTKKKYYKPTLDDEVWQAEAGSGEFTETITGLVPWSVYYVSAYARNRRGVTYSDNYVIVPTNTASAHTPYIYNRNFYGWQDEQNPNIIYPQAEITNDRGYFVIERGFCYSRDGSQPTIENNKLIAEGTGLGTFQTKITLPSGRYIFAAYAINEAGVGYGLNKEIIIP